jgi:hypothetical protein
MAGDDMPDCPGDGHASKISEPEPERRGTVEIRFRKGTENQGRHGDLEDEVAQDFSCVCPEEASSHGQPADQDENENRGDIRGNGRHGGKAFAAFAGGYSALEPFRPEWNPKTLHVPVLIAAWKAGQPSHHIYRAGVRPMRW